MSEKDVHFMRHALYLAEAQLGRTAPNPSVGAVLVKDGRVIASGVTARGGRPHAETEALQQAGKNTQGATLYITLEPCAHTGQTPPCVDAIIAARVARVVIACTDSDARTNGASIHQLRDAGIEVTIGVEETAARKLNAGFFNVIEKKRPHIMVKLATTQGGHMQHAEKRWITGENARHFGHMLRAKTDVILTGIGTVLADDPLLDCRLPGLEKDSPAVVILDSDVRLPPESKLAQTAKNRLVSLYCAEGKETSKAGEALRKAGVSIYPIASVEDGLDLTSILQHLAASGVTRVLVEAGPRLTRSFIAAGVADEINWFQNPNMHEGEATSIVNPNIISENFMPHAARPLGGDILTVYEAA